MIEDDDIEGLIQQLKELQVKQAAVIRKLQEAATQKKREDAGIERFTPGDRVVITTKVSPLAGGETTPGDIT